MVGPESKSTLASQIETALARGQLDEDTPVTLVTSGY